MFQIQSKWVSSQEIRGLPYQGTLTYAERIFQNHGGYQNDKKNSALNPIDGNNICTAYPSTVKIV